jgi:hypothetical protein
MSYNDLIRRGDVTEILFDEGWYGNTLTRLDALPASDPLADPRVKALVEALEWQASQPEAHPFMAERARAALAAFKGGEA